MNEAPSPCSKSYDVEVDAILLRCVMTSWGVTSGQKKTKCTSHILFHNAMLSYFLSGCRDKLDVIRT